MQDLLLLDCYLDGPGATRNFLPALGGVRVHSRRVLHDPVPGRLDDFDAVLIALKATPKGRLVDDIDENVPDLEWAFSMCQWECLMDEGDIKGIYFEGDKWHDEHEQFMNTVAPWVPDRSFIECRGEEGEIWKWFFMDGKCEEHQAFITYPTLEKYEAVKS